MRSERLQSGAPFATTRCFTHYVATKQWNTEGQKIHSEANSKVCHSTLELRDCLNWRRPKLHCNTNSSNHSLSKWKNVAHVRFSWSRKPGTINPQSCFTATGVDSWFYRHTWWNTHSFWMEHRKTGPGIITYAKWISATLCRTHLTPPIRRQFYWSHVTVLVNGIIRR